MNSSIASLLMVMGIWLSLSVLCCAGDGSSSTYRIRYRVDGHGPAHVVYSNESGGTVMHDVVLPWQEEMNIPYGESLYLSAQDAGGAGEITVSITVNGRIVKDATSTGEFTIATVSDFCCRE